MPRTPLALPLRFWLAAAFAFAHAASAHAAPSTAPATPLHFVPNLGQFAAATRFFGFTSGATVRVEDGAVTYQFRREAPGGHPRDPLGRGRDAGGALSRVETLDIRATFPGARRAAAVDGIGRTPHLSHFYFGDDPSRWRTHVPGYEGVRLRALWPGIDLVYHGNGRELEYDFHVAPGADPRIIRVRYDGIEGLRVTESGDLEVTTRFGRTLEAAPVAYQVLGGERREVAARYRRLDDRTFAFTVAARHDPDAPLVIDPVLKYSTLIGGISYDEVHDIVSDIPGNAYLAGGTLSPGFPASGSPVPNTDYVAYVTKIDPTGSSLVYSVFLGGSANQIAYGIRIDAAGNAYVAGVTGSNDFPTTSGCFDPTFNGTNPGDADLFVAKLSPSGTLLYGTYLGGTGGDTGGRVALDQNGIVYVVGVTGSNDYPVTTGAYDLTYNGANDIMVSGLSCAGSGSADLVYSTYLGGSGDDEAYDIEVDWADDVYLAGSTRSSNFPATGGPPFNNTFDAVVARIKPLGAGPADLSLAMKFGDANQDYGGGVKPNGQGEIFFSGSTASPSFPTVTGWQTTYGGGPYDAFLMRINYDGTLVYWSTFVGGSGEEHGGDIALGPQWNPTLVGYTNSAGFPTFGTPFQGALAGDRDIFLTSSDAYATPFYGTFLGGTQMDVPYGIAEDAGGRQFIAGNTQTSDYPLTPAAYDTSYNGGAIDVAVTKFATANPDTCESCASPPDTCCAQPPGLGAVEHPFLSGNLLVGTRQATAYPVCVVIYDLGSPLPSPLEDTDWSAMTRWAGPGNSWNQDSLGTVFGLTLDKFGNIFVTHTSCYSPDAIGQVAGGAAGAVYRIDANTATITTFCVLPNSPDGSVTIPNENYPGLGNISYDCRHDQFFVTNLEDGRIYRIKANGVNGTTGTVLETFDPLAPDNGIAGWAPAGERLWGVQVHGDRVYYAVWAETAVQPSATAVNEIRSVGLLAGGAFDTSAGSDRHELFLPPRVNTDASNPVSDISFSAAGRMMLGERGVDQLTIPTAHEARSLEYECVAGCWLPTNPFHTGIITAENSAGGVDYDRFPWTGAHLGRVWVTADALHGALPPYSDVLYGIQGFRPTGGSIQNSMLIDSDGDVSGGDKHSIGDVEAPGCVNTTVGSICGRKYNDLDHDGVKDSGEPGLASWTLVLNGPGGPYFANTDNNGFYCFTHLPPGNYTLAEQMQSGWLQTAPAGGSYNVTVIGGQTAAGRDFGNYACGGSGMCAPPPPRMVAWWPFDEPVSATTAKDVTHLSPAKNVANLVGGAAITAGGHKGRMLCVPGELDYAVVPFANQLGFQFGAGSFAADAWVQLPPAAGPRMLVEKRAIISGTVTRGFALYFVGLQAHLDLGNGIVTQVIPGPTVAANTWQHVAFSVDRTTGQGRWYLNGAVVPAFHFTPVTGPISSAADLWIGQSAVFPTMPLLGCVDDLEVFFAPNGNPLPAASVATIHAAGAAGKCADIVRLPESTTICAGQTSVPVCFTICNTAPVTQSYHWTINPLPAGPGCTVAGPTPAPASGTVTLLPGACSAAICVTMPRPPGLTAQNATACFELLVLNDSTGACVTSRGQLRAENCLCPGTNPLPGGPIAIPGRLAPGVLGVAIPFPWFNPCGGFPIPYHVTAVYEPVGHEDPLLLSLNGLPPGEPVIGTLVDESGTGGGVVTVLASLPDGYDLMAHYRIVLEADMDGDGQYERIDERQTVSTYEDEVTTGVEPGSPAVDATRLVLSPNPFFRGSAVSFSLGRAADATLAVYDIGGRVVRELHRGRLGAGPQRFDWNGRDAAGREVPAGIYFVRLDSERIRLDAKLVKLR